MEIANMEIANLEIAYLENIAFVVSISPMYHPFWNLIHPVSDHQASEFYDSVNFWIFEF